LWAGLLVGLLAMGAIGASAQAPAGVGTGPREASSVEGGQSLAPVVTEYGRVTLSVDGLGSNSGGGIIQVEKPAGATVRRAYMAAASTGFSGYTIQAGNIKINDNFVAFTTTVPCSAAVACVNHWAEVTSIVKPIVDGAPAGRVDLIVTEDASVTTRIDGEILAVIFDDPNRTADSTIVLLFGAQNVAGDTFSIGLSEPLDTSNPDLILNLGLGISFGAQVTNQPQPQFSEVSVNQQRMTSAAGGQDDGALANGALLTVGGLDDSTDNPADPHAGPAGNPRSDDELYNLLPFVENGDTSIEVFTLNPSNDDNIFFASLLLGNVTAVVGEGIVLGPAEGEACIASDEYTVTATVQDTQGNPIANRAVTFNVTSGPNVGASGTAPTNASGQATFTYTSGVAGTDVVQASFVTSGGETLTSNQVTVVWEDCTTSVTLSDVQALPAVAPHALAPALAALTLLAGLVIALRRRK
jgi:hypothetical protein